MWVLWWTELSLVRFFSGFLAFSGRHDLVYMSSVLVHSLLLPYRHLEELTYYEFQRKTLWCVRIEPTPHS